MPYGIVLLPEEHVAKQAVAISNAVAPSDAIMTLDKLLRPPHITVLHIEADRAAAAQWWEKAKANIEATYELTITGLLFRALPVGYYYVPQGGMYFGLEVGRSQELKQAHQVLLDTAGESDLSPLGAIRDDYAPHLTLGVMPSSTQSAHVPFELIGASFTARLAFGRIGACGVVDELIEVVQ